jgi:hypothetical protein
VSEGTANVLSRSQPLHLAHFGNITWAKIGSITWAKIGSITWAKIDRQPMVAGISAFFSPV